MKPPLRAPTARPTDGSRSSVFCLLACSVLLVVAGCAKRETPVLAGVRTQTLHFGNHSEPATLDPHLMALTAEMTLCTALYEGLVNIANDGKTILPGVAERWEISPDGRTYRFHLRANARWSNGDAITADDFIATWRRLFDPRFASSVAQYVLGIEGAENFFRGKSTDFAAVGVKALDPATLEVKLSHRAPPYLPKFISWNMSFVPLHLRSLEATGGRYDRSNRWTVAGAMVSNGPFMLKEWRQNQVIILARNPHYWDAARVRLSEIWIYPNEDEAGEERAYRAGQLHVTARLPRTRIAAHRVTPALQEEKLLQTQLITFNTKRPPFTDARVRRAFSCAIDRKVITSRVLNGTADPAHSMSRPGLGGFDPPVAVNYAPDEARRLLAEAGFPHGAGFPVVEFRFGGSSDMIAMAETLQAMWQQTLKVSVTLFQSETKSLIAAINAQQHQLASVGYYVFDDPDDMLLLGVTGFTDNSSGWSDSGYDAAFAASRETPDEPARRAIFTQLEERLAEAAPYAPIFHLNRLRLVHPVVRGWRSNPIGLVDWRELWLEPAK